MDAKKLHPLSPTEVLILKYLWEVGKANAKEVAKLLQALQEKKGETPNTGEVTASTFLWRMRDKGYVRSSPSPSGELHGPGRPAYIYSPLISYKEGLRRHFEGFLENLFLNAEDFAILESVVSELRAKSEGKADPTVEASITSGT
jgi:predicted transcriptional regulator